MRTIVGLLSGTIFIMFAACGDTEPLTPPPSDTLWSAPDTGWTTPDTTSPSLDTSSASMPDSILPGKDTAPAPQDTAPTPQDTNTPPTDTGQATPVDTSSPPPVAGSCAGRCDEFDQAFECQCDMACYDGQGTDCCPDYEAVCKADDGVYETCLKTKCKSTSAACLNNDTCAAAFKCLVGCGGDFLCAKGCGDELSGLNKTKFDNLVQCSSDNGCGS